MSRFKVSALLVITLLGISACKTNPSPTSVPTVPVIPVEAKIPVEPILNECIVCHTDQQMLIETAKPEEAKEVESSGAG